MCVCVLCISSTITFESLDVETSMFSMRVYLQEIRVMFVYEGHRVKVKVTGAKKREIPYSRSRKVAYCRRGVGYDESEWCDRRLCHVTGNTERICGWSALDEKAVLFVEERSAEGDQLQSQRVVRIVTKDLPRYFATVTRCRLETATIGPAGAILSSTVDPQVQAVFPEGALMKSIKVGLQVFCRCIHI